MDIFVDFLKKIIEILPTLVSVVISNNYIFFRSRYDKQNTIIQQIYKSLNYTYTNPKKWYTCNLFKQLTGLNLSFKDIQILVAHDDVGRIIYQITKYRGIYMFQNGKFIEKKSKFITKISNFFLKLTSIGTLILLVLLVILFLSTESTPKMIIYFVDMVVLSIYWVYSMKTLDDIKEAKVLLTNFNNEPQK